MRSIDLIRSAIMNTFRNRLRTTLTATAIIIGAFVLSLTLSISNGLNTYIDTTVASVGSPDTITVTKQATGETTTGHIKKYDPQKAVAIGMEAMMAAMGGDETEPLTPDDVEKIEQIKGVHSVYAVRASVIDYVQLKGAGDDERFQIMTTIGIQGVALPLAAGEEPNWDSKVNEISLLRDYVESFGLGSPEELVGKTVVLGVSTPTGQQKTVEAKVVGVNEPVLTDSPVTASTNAALADAMNDIKTEGIPKDARDRWSSASISVEAEDGVPIQTSVERVKTRLANAGYTGQTIDDLLGMMRAFFDAILIMLVLFAAITLLAGSLGIVNTLLMSVQERTSEIGLLKALGLTSGRVFTLFSLEAVTIGILSAAIGVGGTVLIAGPVNTWLADGPLKDLPGLTLMLFNPQIIVGVTVLIVGIAFLAGTLPARRAAAKDPITALRHE